MALSPEKAAFVQAAAVAAQASEAATGVPASVTIAQAILESGWGEHHMGNANNYFGIKAQVQNGQLLPGNGVATGFVMKSTREVIGGQSVMVDAPFRSYADMAGSFTDHGLFLKNNARYGAAMAAYAADKDAKAFARGIAAAGYATDPNYAHLLISIMDSNNLYQFNAP